MEWSVFIFIGFVLFLVFRSRSSWKAPETKAPDAQQFQFYEAAPSLFVNRSELAFYHALVRALPDGYFALTKVRLEDVIRVKHQLSNPKMRWSLRGRIKSRHIDFVVMDSEGKPRIAIELDGRSHRKNTAKNADDLKNGLFQQTNIHFYRIKTGENFAAKVNLLVQSLNSP